MKIIVSCSPIAVQYYILYYTIILHFTLYYVSYPILYHNVLYYTILCEYVAWTLSLYSIYQETNTKYRYFIKSYISLVFAVYIDLLTLLLLITFCSYFSLFTSDYLFLLLLYLSVFISVLYCCNNRISCRGSVQVNLILLSLLLLLCQFFAVFLILFY